MKVKSGCLIIIPFVLVTMVGSFAFACETNTTKPPDYHKNAIGSDSLFQPNEALGWGNYGSYVNNIDDSVELELILYRNVPDSIDWNTPSEIGTIDSNYAPVEPQILEIKEVTRNWRMIILPDSTCTIQLIDGEPPSDSTIFIPIKTKYKKS